MFSVRPGMTKFSARSASPMARASSSRLDQNAPGRGDGERAERQRRQDGVVRAPAVSLGQPADRAGRDVGERPPHVRDRGAGVVEVGQHREAAGRGDPRHLGDGAVHGRPGQGRGAGGQTGKRMRVTEHAQRVPPRRRSAAEADRRVRRFRASRPSAR